MREGKGQAAGSAPNIENAFAIFGTNELQKGLGEMATPAPHLQLISIAVSCRDGILPRDAIAYRAVVDNVFGVAPRFAGVRFGESVATTCVSWPSPTASLTPLKSGVARTLVIANTFDPTTPIVWSRGLAAQLGAPLLIRNGGGHVAVNKSGCIRDAVARFLVDGTPPASGTVCSPDLANPS